MHWVTQHALIVVGVLVTALAVIFVLQQRRTAQSTAAWVLFIVVVLYVANPLFLMLGFRKQGSRFPPVALTAPIANTVADGPAARSLAKLGAPPATKGNTFTLHDSARAAQEALQETLVQQKSRLISASTSLLPTRPEKPLSTG